MGLLFLTLGNATADFSHEVKGHLDGVAQGLKMVVEEQSLCFNSSPRYVEWVARIDQLIAEGKELHAAILDAAVSRLQPVATTILGLIPLLQDIFFVNMFTTIMAGLGFATVLTLVIVPTLYAILFRVKRPVA